MKFNTYILWLLCHILAAETTINKTYLKELGCDVDLRAQNLTGDFIIGGIFPANYRSVEDGVEKYSQFYTGMNWVAAMLYTIEQINNSTSILPGIQLGYDIRDSCNSPEIAVQHTLDFLLDVDYYKPNLFSVPGTPAEINTTDAPGIKSTTPSTAPEKLITPVTPDLSHSGLCIDPQNSTSRFIGVIGGAVSPVSSIISTILSTDYIPQISYASTSAALSEKRWHYRNFLRTVPSDKHQARAIVDLIVHFGWSYISAFAIDDEYGRIGLDELVKAANEKGICFATAHFFDQDIVKNSSKLNHILKDLTEFREKSHIVILWSTFLEARHIIEEAERQNVTHITWIGTDIWNEYVELWQGFSQNIIFLKLGQPPVNDYINYMTTYLGVVWKNPWFRKFFKPFCPQEVLDKYTLEENQRNNCKMSLNPYFVSTIITTEQRKYPQVIAAVYTLAFGLHEYLNCTKSECTPPKGGIDYKKLLDIVRVCDFIVPNTTSYHVSFDQSTGEIQQKQYEFVLRRENHVIKFGTWYGAGNLTVRRSGASLWGQQGKPEGRCSETCLPGHYRLNGSSPCCWECLKCLENTISSRENQYRCTLCRQDYEVANDNRTVCIRLREIRITLRDYVGLLLLVSSIVGVLIVLFIIAVFIHYWDTPVVKSSSREISIIQLVSLMLLFCLPVMYFFPLFPTLCMLRTLVFGFLFTTVVAIILVKTYRLIRVFSNRFTKVSRFLHSRYQILFIYALVIFELIAIFLWNWNFVPGVLRDVHLMEKILYITCDRHQVVIFWIVLLYIFILTLFTGYLAFRARKLPEIYNEAQFISLAMFTACIVWIAYVPLFFSLSPYENNIAFLVENFVCTLSLTLILFSYKVNVILFHPHMNSSEYARRAQHEHFLDSLHKDIARNPISPTGNTSELAERPRINSLPIAVHKPSVFDETDGKGRTSDGQLRRRASFTSMSHLESMRRYKSYDTFATLDTFLFLESVPERRMKKSQSTPLLGDETPPLAGNTHAKVKTSASHDHHSHHNHRPLSTHLHAIGRVLSRVSINKLLHGHEQESSRSLLSSSSENDVDTKL